MSYPGYGSPLFGAPSTPPRQELQVRGEDRIRGGNNPRLLWRPQTFRVAVAPTVNTPLFPARQLVSALQIYADSTNVARVLLGNRDLTSVLTGAGGIPGNNYIQLDPGRSAYIWTDNPEEEVFDVAMFFSTQESVGTTQYLHCTAWQGQRL